MTVEAILAYEIGLAVGKLVLGASCSYEEARTAVAAERRLAGYAPWQQSEDESYMCALGEATTRAASVTAKP